MNQAKTERPAGGAKALIMGLLLAALLAASITLAAGKPAQAASTFTVTVGGDTGEGNCAINGCTLREAVEHANGNPGKDTIEFNIPRAGVQSFRPTSQLPTITEAVTIDGYSQFGAEPNTRQVGNDANLLIELDGVNAGSGASGLRIEADDVTARGLVIQRFDSAGVSIRGNANRVEGNFIGTDPTGRRAGPGNGKGVSIFGGERNTVGGDTPAARNLISANEGTGVDLFGSVFATRSNKVQNNYIGTDKFGGGALGNGFAGVFIADSSSNVIGGGEAEANIIAFNAQDGVAVRSLNNTFADTGNAIRSNSIYSNGDLGIDLRQDGPTANDPKDPDIGENDLQNKPTLTSAATSGGATTVRGKLNSTPGKLFVVEFFSNPSGADEGKTLLGQKAVTTNADGKATFTSSQAVPAGENVTATATDRGRNTSEFSAPRTVTAQ